MGFGSLEAALTTTADVALQIALAGGLGRAGAGLQELLADFLSGFKKAQNKAAEMSGVLTAMSVKKYPQPAEKPTEFTEHTVAMWKATKYASYILGDYEEVLRENINCYMKTEQEGLLKSCLHQLLKKL
jgi:hypothetical protein